MDCILQSDPTFSAKNLNLHEFEYRDLLREAEVNLMAAQRHVQEKSRRKMQERLERERSS